MFETVVGEEIDETELVETHQRSHQLGRREIVGREDLVVAHQIEGTHRSKKKFRVVHHLGFLFGGELRQALMLAIKLTGELCQFNTRRLESLIESIQAHVAFGEHPLYAGLRHTDGHRQLGVGEAARFEFALEVVNQLYCFGHG